MPTVAELVVRLSGEDTGAVAMLQGATAAIENLSVRGDASFTTYVRGAGTAQQASTSLSTAIAKIGNEAVPGLGTSLSGASSALQGLAGDASLAEVALGGVGIAAAAAAVGGIADATKSFIGLSDSVRLLSQMTGLTENTAQAMGYALQSVGASGDTTRQALDFMARNSENLRIALENGTKPAGQFANALKELGINAQQFTTENADTQLRTLMDAFQNLSPSVNRTALEMDVFSRGGAQMAPLLSQGASVLDVYKGKMADAGAGVADTQARVLALHRATTDLDIAEQGLANTVGELVVPVLTTMAHDAELVAEKIHDAAGVVGDFLGKARDFANLGISVGGLTLKVGDLANAARVGTESILPFGTSALAAEAGLRAMGTGADTASTAVQGTSQKMQDAATSAAGLKSALDSVFSKPSAEEAAQKQRIDDVTLSIDQLKLKLADTGPLDANRAAIEAQIKALEEHRAKLQAEEAVLRDHRTLQSDMATAISGTNPTIDEQKKKFADLAAGTSSSSGTIKTATGEASTAVVQMGADSSAAVDGMHTHVNTQLDVFGSDVLAKMKAAAEGGTGAFQGGITAGIPGVTSAALGMAQAGAAASHQEPAFAAAGASDAAAFANSLFAGINSALSAAGTAIAGAQAAGLPVGAYLSPTEGGTVSAGTIESMLAHPIVGYGPDNPLVMPTTGGGSRGGGGGSGRGASAGSATPANPIPAEIVSWANSHASQYHVDPHALAQALLTVSNYETGWTNPSGIDANGPFSFDASGPTRNTQGAAERAGFNTGTVAGSLGYFAQSGDLTAGIAALQRVLGSGGTLEQAAHAMEMAMERPNAAVDAARVSRGDFSASFAAATGMSGGATAPPSQGGWGSGTGDVTVGNQARTAQEQLSAQAAVNIAADMNKALQALDKERTQNAGEEAAARRALASDQAALEQALGRDTVTNAATVTQASLASARQAAAAHQGITLAAIAEARAADAQLLSDTQKGDQGAIAADKLVAASKHQSMQDAITDQRSLDAVVSTSTSAMQTQAQGLAHFKVDTASAADNAIAASAAARYQAELDAAASANKDLTNLETMYLNATDDDSRAALLAWITADQARIASAKDALGEITKTYDQQVAAARAAASATRAASAPATTPAGASNSGGASGGQAGAFLARGWDEWAYNSAGARMVAAGMSSVTPGPYGPPGGGPLPPGYGGTGQPPGYGSTPPSAAAPSGGARTAAAPTPIIVQMSGKEVGKGVIGVQNNARDMRFIFK